MQQFAKAQGGEVDAFLLAALVLCVGVLAATDGNLVLTLAPIAAGLFVVALWRLPMRIIAHVLLFLALLVDNPTERPGRLLYKSPLLLLGNPLYEAISKTFHIPGMKMTGLELLFIVLSLIIGVRIVMGHPVDGEARRQAAAPLMKACMVSMGALISLELYGMLRGGSLPHSLLQMRAMFFMPFMTMFFAYAFKRRRDVHVLLATFTLVAIARAFVCFYYWATVMRHNANAGGESGDGSYVTTHSDSILAAVAIVICIVSIYQHPTLRTFVITALVVPIIGLGVVLNNRRIAFVAVALGFFFSYLAANRYFRRRVQRTVMSVLPVALLYVAAGWGAQGGWAKPVQSLKSVIMQKDTSSATRDIENYNLLETMKQNPVIGSGFGHEYLEKVKAFDISKIFEAYRYVPHNSILWFWGVGGVVGFTAYWMFLVVGVFMAARLTCMAESNRQAVMGMTAMSAVIAWASQCFGDMGLMSWMGGLVVASSLGICGSLCSETGAWSAGTMEVPVDQLATPPRGRLQNTRLATANTGPAPKLPPHGGMR